MTSAAIGGASHTQASLVTLLRETIDALDQLVCKYPSMYDVKTQTMPSELRTANAKLAELLGALTKPNPDVQGFYWWLVAIGFAEGRVVDGVQLDARTTHNMVRNTYQFIRGRDIRTKIIAQPSSEAIEKARSEGSQ